MKNMFVAIILLSILTITSAFAEDFTLTQSIKWTMGSEIETSSGKLRGVSEDGDFVYADALRKGVDGVSKMSGGTGKYKNVTADCVYQIANSNKEASLGLVTMKCTTN